MNLPIVCIVTKIDLVSEDNKKTILNDLKHYTNKLGLNKVPIVMKTNDDIVLFSRNIQEKNILPIFMVSNLKWDGLRLLKNFLSMLPVIDQSLESVDEEQIEFDIHETLQVEDKLIVSGIVNKGRLVSQTKCYLGPDSEGKFKIVEIVNIHCKKIAVKNAYKGQYCSIYIKSEFETAELELKKENVRKGMVLLDINSIPSSVRMFEAELWAIDGSAKIVKYKYQPVLNIKHIRQGCRLKNKSEFFLDSCSCDTVNLNNLIDESNMENVLAKLEKNKFEKRLIENNNLNVGGAKKYSPAMNYNPDEAFILTSTSKTKVVFEFMFNPEYINIGSHVIISDQLVKAFGIVTKVYK